MGRSIQAESISEDQNHRGTPLIATTIQITTKGMGITAIIFDLNLIFLNCLIMTIADGMPQIVVRVMVNAPKGPGQNNSLDTDSPMKIELTVIKFR